MKKAYHEWSMEDIFWHELSGIGWEQIGMAFLLALIVFIPGIIRIKKKKSTIKEVLLAYWVVVWAGIMLLITIFRREPGSATLDVNPFPTWDNFGGFDYATAFSIYNVWLFIPWGFFLRLYNHRKPDRKAFGITLLISFLTTCTIEISQLITRTGYFEFTDIINNCIGGFIGAVIGGFFLKIYRGSDT